MAKSDAVFQTCIDNLTEFWEIFLNNRKLPFERAYITDDLFEFMAYCLRNTNSNAQFFQDIYVLYKLKEKRNGFFVEFGATDGISINNTYLLEKKYGWKGIVAEPNPRFHKSLKKNRKAIVDTRCVWSESGRTLKFIATDNPDISTIKSFRDKDYLKAARKNAHEISVTTISLTELLSQHRVPKIFDYLSIDTEGSEFEILKAHNFNRYSPRIITVEHNYNFPVRAKIHRLLTSKGYVRELELVSLVDDWYYHPKMI